MSRLFKKGLFGYNTSDVDIKIRDSKADFDHRYKELEENFTAAKIENDRLNEELKILREEQNAYNEYNQELELVLRHAYENASLEVYHTRERLAQEIDEKAMELENLQNKNQDINNSINKLLDKLQSIVSKY